MGGFCNSLPAAILCRIFDRFAAIHLQTGAGRDLVYGEPPICHHCSSHIRRLNTAGPSGRTHVRTDRLIFRQNIPECQLETTVPPEYDRRDSASMAGLIVLCERIKPRSYPLLHGPELEKVWIELDERSAQARSSTTLP